MKLKRNYLTSEEIAVIVANMVEKEYAVEREILKVGLTAQILLEDLGEFDNCDDIYDVVMKNGIDFSQVINYDKIDYLVEQEIGVKRVLKDFVKTIDEKVSKSFDNLDLNGAIKQLGEIVNKDNTTEIKSPRKAKNNGNTKVQ